MGRAAARCLAEDGATVAVLGRHRGRLDETVKDLLAPRRNGYTTGADVNVDGGSDFC
jgi:NAD(P)-dependent dehydrogenase (short-subunit alcohol dehydrogenase family)